MKSIKDILAEPHLTEKSASLRFEDNQFVFKVKVNTNKKEIKRAVETRFNVIVEDVNTVTIRGKKKNTRGITGQAPTWKKAFVSVRKGDTIPEFEGA